MDTPHVTRWAGSDAPTESTLMRLCADEGLYPYTWSNGPHDTYAAHSHSADFHHICTAKPAMNAKKTFLPF